MTDTPLLNYHVEQVKPLTDKVIQLFLAPDDQQLQYHAGQYVEIVLDENNARPFSIANAPLGAKTIELHIRHSTADPFLDQLLSRIRQQRSLQLRGPHGKLAYHADTDPLLFVAAGTGFAPMKAIIEAILASNDATPMHLFWGASTASDLYLDALPIQWQSHVAHFDYTPVLSKPHPEDDWQGEIGLLQEVVKKYYADLSQHQVYCAGPMPFVKAAYELFQKMGLSREAIHSDLL